jgi:hypothetical protein
MDDNGTLFIVDSRVKASDAGLSVDAALLWSDNNGVMWTEVNLTQVQVRYVTLGLLL